MNRVDVRLAKITGQPEREFEIVVVDDEEELGWFARLGAKVLRSIGIVEEPGRRTRNYDWYR